MRITITIEHGDGKRVEFERESDDYAIKQNGIDLDSPVNARRLDGMWNEVKGEVDHWMRYRLPAEGRSAS